MRFGIQNKKVKNLIVSLLNHVKYRAKGSNLSVHSPIPSASALPAEYMPHIDYLAKRLDGKLLLREEIPLSHEDFHHFVNHHYFISIPAIQTHATYSICNRCQNKNKSLFAEIDCARCHTTHLYCRNCIEMGRVMACAKFYYWNGPSYEREYYKNPCTWLGKLNPAQRKAAKYIQSTISARKRLLVWAVTGAGKTEMLFPGINDALEKGLRIGIVSPRADVVRELLPRIQSAFRDVFVQALYSGSKDNDGTAPLILATIHQLYRYQHAFDVLVIDEVDAFPYHQDRTLKQAANRAKKSNAAVIELTATPRASQQKEMYTKRTNHVFVPMRFHGHPLIIPKWKHVPRLQMHMTHGILPNQWMTWWRQRERSDRQCIMFVPTIQIAKNLEISVREYALQHQMIKHQNEVTSVHAEDLDREEKVTGFRKYHIKLLITTTILERGVTFPSVDVVVLDAGHDVFDDAALVQISGRAGRSPKDPDGEVVFFHDGLTEAMVKANHAIEKMNQRRVSMLGKGGKR